MTPLVLWLVRHAPVSAEGLCYGQSEVPVTIPPPDAADRVMASLAGRPGSVWSSPWARARDLGAALAERLGLPLCVDPRLSELDMGAWEGRRFADLARDEGAALDRWMGAWQTEAPPGGETVAALESRVASWLEAQRRAGERGSPVLVVAHAGPIRALRRLVCGASWDAVMREPVPHLTVEAITTPPA